MYKVLLVEDETVIRQGLRELIVQASPQFEVVGKRQAGPRRCRCCAAKCPMY